MVAPSTVSASKLKAKFSLDDFGLGEGWVILQRRWKTLALSVIGCWALGLVYCYFAQQKYESNTQVLVMRKDTSLATTGAPSANSQEPEVSEDLLATHMEIFRSTSIVGKALERTIKLSELNALKAEQKKDETQKSMNLRFILPRLMNAASAPATDATAAAVTPESTSSAVTPTETASTETPAAEASSVTPAPASTEVAAATVPATPTPAADVSATALPASTAVTTSEPTATSGIEPVSEPIPYETDPITGLPVRVDGEPSVADAILDAAQVADLPPLTSDARTLPPGPLPDGDTVIMLAELPGVMENLETNQLPVQYVIENMVVSRGGSAQSRDSHVLGVSFQHVDQVETRLVLDALIRSYQSFLNDKFQSVSREAAKLIAESSKELEQELQAAQDHYQRFREQSPVLFNGDQNTNIHRLAYETASNTLIELQGKLTEARARLEEVEQILAQRETLNLSELEMLALIDETNAARLSTLVAVTAGEAQSPAFLATMAERTGAANTDFGELLKAKAELTAMLKDYGPQHPEVIKLKSRIEVAEAFVAQKRESLKVDEADLLTVVEPRMVMSAYLRLLRSDVGSLERREQLLMQMAAEEEERAKALTAFELEGEKLREQVARGQELYDAVLDRLREINLAKDYSGFVNEVIEAPEYGAEVWPSIPIVLALATVLGLLCGVGTAAVSEYRDRSFKDPEDIRRDLDTVLLTHVPDLRGLARDPKQLVEGSQVHPSIYAYHKPKSRESEVFRGLRTSLFFSSNGQKCQVIMFTSPNQGDGKSTVCSNLAVSIAQTGRKVLIVDCDLRRPNSHKLLGVKNDVGLSDVISGDVEPWDAIKQTETTNLWCLPSGPLPANPAELLQSTAFEQFVNMAREKYDYVILDCPPVLAVADPCIVAPRADGITLVLRVSRDSRPQAAKAKEMLARVNGRVLGVVVNASEEAAKAGYGKYGDSAYAYSYDYGYGKGYGRGYNKYYEEDPSTERANGSGR